MLAEAKALADRFPSVKADDLFTMATWNGARALGRNDLGCIARGARPGVYAVVPASGETIEHPARWLLTHLGEPRVCVVPRKPIVVGEAPRSAPITEKQAARLACVAGNELVMFSHTIFALPFAASAVVLALAEPHVPMTAMRVLAMLGCMVTARTSAMAFNRYADRDVDAKNPRTAGRPVPSGRVSPREALALTVLSGLAFCGLAATLGFWPMVLAPPVLLVLLGYSLAKRFTWAAHAWLGLALALAPGGAWLATGATPNLGIILRRWPSSRGSSASTSSTRSRTRRSIGRKGLRLVPARFGTKNAGGDGGGRPHRDRELPRRRCAPAASGAGLPRRVALVAAILVVEHRLVRGKDGKADLSKIPKAFFDCNAYVSMGFFAATLIDALAFTHT